MKRLSKGHAYLRTSGEINPADSIDNQRFFIEDYGLAHGIEIVEYLVDEKRTGTNQNRTSFQKLLILINNGLVDIILVTTFDRLGRNNIELALFLIKLKSLGNIKDI
ncbi:recombinase family protein [Bacillus luteolus]|uniref:Recombinase family protein n=1 Tax=Litchfieldia luteola TaxID=682179 RepID=A0ABR9QF31_9BACI|nr:recombinase family protein [Cytobacillus luteolus]MBE4907099.1 recombinase family protein [Cytobacillus luteolus]MBP1943433.1 DNA invertase Pin-like site-specific DNA recombinase [Cytobacillus luteolus]